MQSVYAQAFVCAVRRRVETLTSFTDVTVKAGISSVRAGYGLTAVPADFDGDGWPDIYVACDTSPSLLFRNNHDGTFTEQGLECGVAYASAC